MKCYNCGKKTQLVLEGYSTCQKCFYEMWKQKIKNLQYQIEYFWRDL